MRGALRPAMVLATLAAGAWAVDNAAKTREHVPRRVVGLAKEAKEMEREGRVDEARGKLKEAIAVVDASTTRPPPARTRGDETSTEETAPSHGGAAKFRLAFELAESLEREPGRANDAEQAYVKALAYLESGRDLHALRPTTRLRVGVALDRLAQKAHDRGEKEKALGLYRRSLDALATPQEILTPTSEMYAREGFAVAVAGVLHNLGVLFGEMGLGEEARSAEETSAVVLARMEKSKR